MGPAYAFTGTFAIMFIWLRIVVDNISAESLTSPRGLTCLAMVIAGLFGWIKALHQKEYERNHPN